MAVFSLTGAKVEIGAVVALKAAAFVAADFTTPLAAAVVIGEPETLGGVGITWDSEEFSSVTASEVKTYKTGRKNDPVELVFGLDPLDAGQLALRAAALTRDNYAFRLTLADQPATGASPKASTRLIVGTVMSVSDDMSGKIGKMKATIAINGGPVITHASPT